MHRLRYGYRFLRRFVVVHVLSDGDRRQRGQVCLRGTDGVRLRRVSRRGGLFKFALLARLLLPWLEQRTFRVSRKHLVRGW